MPFELFRSSCRWVFAALLACSGLTAQAQATGLLYDPEPPADSAYVRILIATGDVAADVWVDGKLRIKKLVPGEASEFMVLVAGKRSIAIHPAGKGSPVLSTALDVVSGRAMTIAFAALKADLAPVVFEDKTNANRLKALLAVYHLDPKAGALDVLTTDGNTRVFSDLTYGISKSIPVNPISIELMVGKSGDKVRQTSASLSMTQGRTYSLLLLPGVGGKPSVRVLENKIERYTGK